MFLKSLEIKGFKSFAEGALLDLEPGVTVVVGPNGSGKSNVVDAIGWVLGAQSPKSVRSQKMDDVIFAGTSKRPALGRAEVSLTIDNESKTLPIEFAEVKITRRLFRSGDSEYAINDVPCRLLDIQELLSDSGVGRQQHVIISQGQIDAVLNAKPEERRLIIEEAAGVLKYRRRKEKSERRLEATEANLLRVQDMLREVRRQLRPLERQADAARRHDQVAADLRSLKLYLTGRRLSRLSVQLSESATERHALQTEERELKDKLGGLDGSIIEIESRLSTLGGNDIGDVLVRYESLRERAGGLVSLLGERRRGIERARDAFFDEGVVASLESEHAQLVTQREDVIDLVQRCHDAISVIDELSAVTADDEAKFDAEWSQDPDASGRDAVEVRSRLAALATAAKQDNADIERTERQAGSLRQRLAQLLVDQENLQQQSTEAAARRDELDAAANETAQTVERCVSTLDEAESRSREVSASYASWEGRATALEIALNDARSQAGIEHLSEVDGVLGTLLDLVEVSEGWEHAFEAAAGEALGAVVVESPDVARRAVSALASDDVSGAILALSSHLGSTGSAPTVGTPITNYVTGQRSGVDELLATLLSDVVVVDGDWSEALDCALSNPALTVVTRAGDRFGTSGWRVGQAGSGATGAALAEARERATALESEVATAEATLAEAKKELQQARNAASQATSERDANKRKGSDTTERLDRLAQRVVETTTEVDALDAHVAEVRKRLDENEAETDELVKKLAPLEAIEAERDEWESRRNVARAQLDQKIAGVRSKRAEAELELAAAHERSRSLDERIARVGERLDRNKVATQEAQKRRIHFDARLDATDHLVEFVRARLGRIDEVAQGLREVRREQSERTRAVTGELELLRRSRSAAEKELEVTRHKLQRNEISEAEIKMHLEAETARSRDELDVEPNVAVAAECPLLPDGASPQTRLKELERDLRQMGPINPLALEEFAALNERHEFLVSQLDDIRDTRKELSKVIRAVDEEIVRVFAAAFADVAQNFTALFEMLFPGGKGGLTLTDPSNLLDTGLEIEARPSGKNVRKLSLLSGGERSLTALAYLFAVFRSRPSPFYVMDEVEAALDDVNLHRFLSLVQEFRSTAQLVIVSHQKRTMEAADVLYGVSMEQGGSSKVLSEKIRSGSN